LHIWKKQFVVEFVLKFNKCWRIITTPEVSVIQ
jgi:hypothetical protein